MFSEQNTQKANIISTQKKISNTIFLEKSEAVLYQCQQLLFLHYLTNTTKTIAIKHDVIEFEAFEDKNIIFVSGKTKQNHFCLHIKGYNIYNLKQYTDIDYINYNQYYITTLIHQNSKLTIRIEQTLSNDQTIQIYKEELCGCYNQLPFTVRILHGKLYYIHDDRIAVQPLTQLIELQSEKMQVEQNQQLLKIPHGFKILSLLSINSDELFVLQNFNDNILISYLLSNEIKNSTVVNTKFVSSIGQQLCLWKSLHTYIFVSLDQQLDIAYKNLQRDATGVFFGRGRIYANLMNSEHASQEVQEIQ